MSNDKQVVKPYVPTHKGRAAAERFIQIIAGHVGETMHWRCIHPVTQAVRDRKGALADVWETLSQDATDGFCVYIVPNLGGYNDKDIKSIRALFVDLDADKGQCLPDAWHAEPAMIVNTSKGSYHVYWPIADMPPAEFKKAQQRLIAYYNSDRNVCNAARLMRLPGLPNTKRDNYPTTLWSREGDRKGLEATRATLLEGLPPPARREKRKKGFVEEKPPVTRELLEAMMPFIDPECSRNEWLAMLAGLKDAPLREGEDVDLLDMAIRLSAGEFNIEGQPENFKGVDDVVYNYNSLKADKPNGATFGTLVYLARLGGYTGPAEAYAPTIRLIDTHRPRVLDQIDNLLRGFTLLTPTKGVYVKDGHLVEVKRTEKFTILDGVEYEKGVYHIEPLTPERLQIIAERAGRFEKWNATIGCYVGTKLSLEWASLYLAKGDWDLPVLKGVVESPTLRADGSIVQENGYDEASKLLVILSQRFPPISENPTQQDARDALAVLMHPVRGFEFESPEIHKSVYVAAVLTGLLRKALPTAPMFGFNACAPGAGKSLLATLISEMMLGHNAAKMTQGATLEEDEKRLYAALLRGDNIIIIDNCSRPLEGDALCSMATQPEWSGRVLGKSENRTVSTQALVVFTGNNMQFGGDLGERRVLQLYLAPAHDRPEQRVYDWDAKAETLRDRAKLVAAALTVVRAYFVAGRPKPDVTPFGEFEMWCELVRHPLIFAGAADPNLSRAEVMAENPERTQAEALLIAWYDTFGERAVRLKEALRECDHPADQNQSKREAATRLKDVLREIAPSRRDAISVDAKVLGDRLGKLRKRPVGPFKLISTPDKHGARWQVTATSPSVWNV